VPSAKKVEAVSESDTINDTTSARPQAMTLRCSVPANVPAPRDTAFAW
jgi:hypothetical protein